MRANRTLVDGTGYSVLGGDTMIENVHYEVLDGTTLVDGTEYKIRFDVPFADYSWEEIIAACQSRNIPENWAVGDEKPMTINGEEYAIVIIGKDHDDYSDGSGKAPLTFRLKYLRHPGFLSDSSNRRMHHDDSDSSLGWKECDMRNINLNTFKDALPTNVKNALRKVSKVTAKGWKDTTPITTEDDVFILSEYELFGTVSKSNMQEGNQYSYYLTQSNLTVALYDNPTASLNCWTRSPVNYGTGTFMAFVYHEGTTISGMRATNELRRVVPAFCF